MCLFILLHVVVQFSEQHSLKRLFFLYCVSFFIIIYLSVWVYLWIFPLIYMPGFVPAPYGSVYCSFVAWSKVR